MPSCDIPRLGELCAPEDEYQYYDCHDCGQEGGWACCWRGCLHNGNGVALCLVSSLFVGGIDDGVRLFALACAAVGLYDKYGVGTADDDVLLYGVVYHDGLRLGGGVPYGAARGEERQQGDDE